MTFRRDLGKLRRHPKFQEEYDAANRVLAREHGSVGMCTSASHSNFHATYD